MGLLLKNRPASWLAFFHSENPGDLRFKIFQVAVFGFLLLKFLVLPHDVPSADHDVGSTAILEYYYCHGLQWGVDLFQNMGPLGFLHGNYVYGGLVPIPKLLYSFAFTFYLSFLVIRVTDHFPAWPAKYVWLFWNCLLHAPYNYYFLLELVACRLFMVSRTDREIEAWLHLSCLSVLFFLKGTMTMICGGIFLGYGIRLWFEKRWTFLFAVAGLVAAEMMLIYLLSGQHLPNFFSYLSGLGIFSQGYNEALLLACDTPTVVLGIIIILLCLIILGVLWLEQKTVMPLGPFVAVNLLLLYVVWKHSYVRADLHVLYLPCYALAIVPLLGFGRFSMAGIAPGRLAVVLRGLRLGGTVCLFAVCLWFYHHMDQPRPIVNGVVLQGLAQKFSAVWHLPGYLQNLKLELLQAQQEAELVSIKKILGSEPVTYFGYQEGLLLLNQLNYVPQPMPVNFAAANKILMEKNLQFMRHSNPPIHYCLLQYKTIEDHLPAQEDSLAILEVLINYSPLKSEKGLTLLHRRADLKDWSFGPASSQVFHLNESIPIPPTAGKLWIRLHTDYSFWGKMLSLFYKPPVLHMEFQYATQPPRIFRFLPSTAQVGFLIHPLLISEEDFARYLDSEAGPSDWTGETPASLRIVADPVTLGFVQPSVAVEFASIQNDR